MAESLKVDKNLSDEEIYKSIIPQIDNLISENDAVISSLSNFTAALKESFDKISWVGFYFLKDDKLILGPFQGKVACTEIRLGNGVCGTAAAKKETIIVEDVNKFPGHIACDADSKSEIVIPLKDKDEIYGVLDLDSYYYSAFNEIDKIYLEKLCHLLSNKIDFKKIKKITT